jgi:uncharacterized membrane protein
VRLLLTLLKIVAVSAPLTWLWIAWGREAYGELFLELAMPIYGILGLTSVVPEGARDRFINYLPFLILMLVTPRLTLKRRLVGTLVGFLVIFIAQLVFVYLVDQEIGQSTQMTHNRFVRVVPANAMSDSLPFILWVLIARDFLWETVSRAWGEPTSNPKTS